MGLFSGNTARLLYRTLGVAYIVFFVVYFSYRAIFSIGNEYLGWRYLVFLLEFFGSISVVFVVILRIREPIGEWAEQGDYVYKRFGETKTNKSDEVAGDEAQFGQEYWIEDEIEEEEGDIEAIDDVTPIKTGNGSALNSMDQYSEGLRSRRNVTRSHADSKIVSASNASLATTLKSAPGKKQEKDDSSSYVVRILIPCYKESFQIVRETALAALNMGHNKDMLHVYICDDGTDPLKQGWVEAMKTSIPNLHYICRPPAFKGHGKAGNLNYALKHTIYAKFHNRKLPANELIGILDADMIPNERFLSAILHYFTENRRVVMVQTPQTFHNLPMSADFFDAHNMNFFQYLLPAYDSWSTTTCCGTNFLVRSKALKQVGWFPTISVTEDMHLAIRLLSLNGVIRYHGENLCVGEAPMDLRQIFQQRSRWAKGTIQIALKDNPITNQRLNWIQRLTFFNATYSYVTSAFFNPLFILINGIIILCGLFPVTTLDFQTAMLFATYYSLFYVVLHFTPVPKHYLSLWIVGKMGHFFSFMAMKAIINVIKATYFAKKTITFKVTEKKANIDHGMAMELEKVKLSAEKDKALLLTGVRPLTARFMAVPTPTVENGGIATPGVKVETGNDEDLEDKKNNAGDVPALPELDDEGRDVYAEHAAEVAYEYGDDLDEDDGDDNVLTPLDDVTGKKVPKQKKAASIAAKTGNKIRKTEEKRDSTRRDIVFHVLICTLIVFIIFYGIYILAGGTPFIPEIYDSRTKIQKLLVKGFSLLWMFQFLIAYGLPIVYVLIPNRFESQTFALKLLAFLDTIISCGLIAFTIIMFEVPFFRGVPEIADIKAFPVNVANQFWISTPNFDQTTLREYIEASANNYTIPVVVVNTRPGRNGDPAAGAGNIDLYSSVLQSVSDAANLAEFPILAYMEPGSMREYISAFDGLAQNPVYDYIPVSPPLGTPGTAQVNTAAYVPLLQAIKTFSNSLPNMSYAYLDGGEYYFYAYEVGMYPYSLLNDQVFSDGTAPNMRGILINSGSYYSPQMDFSLGQSVFKTLGNSNIFWLEDTSRNGGMWSNTTNATAIEECSYDPPHAAPGESPIWYYSSQYDGYDGSIWIQKMGPSDGRLYPAGAVHMCLINHNISCNLECGFGPESVFTPVCQCD